MRFLNYFSPPYFLKALDRYAIFAEESGWPVSHRFEVYQRAKIAFSSGSDWAARKDAFEFVYEQLSGHWQVFRRAEGRCSVDELFEILNEPECMSCSRQSRLTLAAHDLESAVSKCLTRMSGVETLPRGGYPLMAVSKSLHFYNPTLFPIWDNAIMWGEVMRVFWEDYEHAVGALGRSFWPEPASHFNYLNYIVWMGEAARSLSEESKNEFAQWFGRRVQGRPDPHDILLDCRGYLAAAVEFAAIGAALLEENEPTSGFKDYSASGVDLSLLRYTLSLTPLERANLMERHAADTTELLEYGRRNRDAEVIKNS